MKRILALLGVALALAGTASAQIASGNVYGTAKDQQGAAMPGVNVTIVGETGTRSAVSGSDGTFRFLNLNRGDYTLTLSLAGFATTVRKIRVTTGENVELSFSLKVSAVSETIDVTGETPLVDSKKRGTSTTMTSEELEKIPSARDPWAVLAAVPGVLVDRVNIAGNENGQQASTASKGTGSADRMWNLDGVVITDMSATGASPTYFDFDAFQEISVSTTGADLTTQGGGASINLTTRRGTNSFHGGGRYYIANDNMSFNNLPSSLANDSRINSGLDTGKADHLAQTSDYGFDLGGPILKDKLWFYGSWGKQDIRNVRLNQTYDKSLLSSYNFKVNWQATSNTMVNAFYFIGAKQKFGRAPSKPVQPDDSFLWNQDNAFNPGGLPGGFWKLQVDQTFSPNFFVSVKGAYYDTGFSLAPRGGTDQAWTVDYVRGQGLGSYEYYSAVRPQKNITADANYFFQGMGGNHELKFGFAWRDYKTISTSTVGGNGLVGYLESDTGCAPGAAHCGEVEITRVGAYSYGGKYYDAYIGDTFTKDRFTLNVGVRWDQQKAKNDPATVSANASFPNLLPDLVYDGNNYDPISWKTWSPRVGLSYALDESRKTILRGSFAIYGNLLAFGEVATINPISYGAIAYGWNDFNADKFVQPNEVDVPGGILYSYGVNLDHPGSASSSNRIDQNYKSPSLTEFAAGIDRELSQSLAVGLNYTYRHGSDYQQRPWVGAACDEQSATASSCRALGPADYTVNKPTTANGFTGVTYSPSAALRAAGGGGRIRTNRDGYTTSFSGLELTMTKRLSNKWMSRVAFSFNDWTEDWSGTPTSFLGNPGSTETDPLVKGGQVALLSGGSGKASFYSSVKWQFYANALYQGPWGLDFSGNVFGRQGGPYPINVRLAAGGDGTLSALATPEVDTNRYSDIWNLNLRLAKTIKFHKNTGLTLSAEWFNALNSGNVLARFRQANSSSFTNTSQGAETGQGRIEEIMAPSVFRLGARFSF
jgi:hypothetical protein